MSTQIHPSALVDVKADLGVEVKIGPFVIIEAGVTIGDYCEVQAHAIVCGGTRLGARNTVGYGAILGAEPQDVGFKGGSTGVEIGSDNRIREYVTIHRATVEGGVTMLGNENYLMSGVHLGHDAQVGHKTILANNTLLGGHARVEDGAFLGGATIVHQNGRIGRLAITRGGTRLSRDVPPFFMATDTNLVSGINRVGLRRAGLPQETRRTIQAAFDLLYRSDLNVSQALEEISRKFHLPETTQLVDFVRTSKRGICRAARASGQNDDD